MPCRVESSRRAFPFACSAVLPKENLKICDRTRRSCNAHLNGGEGIDIATIASGEAKEKAGHKTRSASRLSLVENVDKIDFIINLLFYKTFLRILS